MSKSSFAKLITEKIQGAIGTDGGTYSSNTASLCQEAITDAITEYLISNTTVKIKYDGKLITNGSPDPIMQDEFKITGKCPPVSTPSSFSEWVGALQSVIADGFEVLSPGQKGVVATFKPFNPTQGALDIPQQALKDAHLNSKDDPLQVVWEVICDYILQWGNSNAGCNPQIANVSAAIPGTSTGMASLAEISIS